MPKQFLVIQTAFTGDAILASSVLEKLHQHDPSCSIDLLVRKGNEGLYHHHPFLRKVLVWDKKKDKFRHLLNLLSGIRASRYDSVINLQRFASSGILTAFSGAKESIGFNKNPLSFLFTRSVRHIIGDGRHEIDRNQELIAHLTGKDAALPRLYPSAGDEAAVKKFTASPYCCIAPGSVWMTKTWPEAKWVEFIAVYREHFPQHSLYLLGAPNERALCDRIREKSGSDNVITLAGELSLSESAALMRNAVMNFVNDSAPLHLASAMDAPVTAVYCSTVPAFGFGPLSRNSKVVETREKLDCRPCGLHGYAACPKGHFRCALSIEPQQLI